MHGDPITHITGSQQLSLDDVVAILLVPLATVHIPRELAGVHNHASQTSGIDTAEDMSYPFIPGDFDKCV